jgi:hypothetical protein
MASDLAYIILPIETGGQVLGILVGSSRQTARLVHHWGCVNDRSDALGATLAAAGLPEEFSVVPRPQYVPRSSMQAIDGFIAIFDRVTTRSRWQRAVTAAEPEHVRGIRSEACFFSAWDFHIPADAPEHWRLIELNDNGSGFLFASIINRTFYELAHLADDPTIETPPGAARLGERVLSMIEREARGFFGELPDGLFLVIDDADSLARGHFAGEHALLVTLMRSRGWSAQVGVPEELSWRDGALLHHGREVRFVVNRSTDFLWQGKALEPLRRAAAEGRVYVAPNPFTYATRSDKRLLELLSRPERDAELGIEPEERALLGERVAETRLLRDSNVDELLAEKQAFIFKPAQGHASRGVIPGREVGRSRLRRLLRKNQPYVAQRFVPKGRLVVGAEPLWTDLRVWAYRGSRYLVSGRASPSRNRMELTGGGWIPTYLCDDPT